MGVPRAPATLRSILTREALVVGRSINQHARGIWAADARICRMSSNAWPIGILVEVQTAIPEALLLALAVALRAEILILVQIAPCW